MTKKDQRHEREAAKAEIAQAAEQKFTKAEGYVSIYCNNVQINSTFMDFALGLGQIMGFADGVVSVEQYARVLMSPQETKLFMFLLMRQIQAYEQNFGEIVLPSDQITTPDTVDK